MRVIRVSEIARKLGVVPRTVHRLWESDPTFPPRVKIGENVTGAIDEQIDAWLLARAESARKAIPA